MRVEALCHHCDIRFDLLFEGGTTIAGRVTCAGCVGGQG